MKTIKFTLLVVISLTTCFILNACGNGNKQESTTVAQARLLRLPNPAKNQKHHPQGKRLRPTQVARILKLIK